LTNSEEQLNYMELIFRQTNRIIKWDHVHIGTRTK
jgi:hypothetical protein